jgi:hypothetical protein
MVRLEGLGKLKNPMTTWGREPETFRLVAQCLNQLRYRLPRVSIKWDAPHWLRNTVLDCSQHVESIKLYLHSISKSTAYRVPLKRYE